MEKEKQNDTKSAARSAGASVYVLTVLLGAFAGLVIWCFLKAVAVCTELLWEKVPEVSGMAFLPVILCTVGGLIAGILHKKYGDYPEELAVVTEKIKKDKYYDYSKIAPMLWCAFIPLVFGASVGPEAGLTGIIAALCYWVGDNVSFAKKYETIYSEMGEAVTLGQLFHAPLFGILIVEEPGMESGTEVDSEPLPKAEKLLYYGLSTAASLFVIKGLDHVFGKAMAGFPSFDSVTISNADFALFIPYILIGTVLFFFFEVSEKLFKKLSEMVPCILREMLCGLLIGLMSMAVPMVLFSGEEEMSELMQNPGAYIPLFLAGICLLKMIMTSFCINFGMKGGHFFPVIFACTCMGYGLSGLIFTEPAGHVVFAAGIIAAAMLGSQLKKPVTVAVLLLLCFPVKFIFWLFLSAAAGGFIASKIAGNKETGRNR